jgi:hypothetical protein
LYGISRTSLSSATYRTDYGGNDLVQIGEAFDRVGKGLFVDFWIFFPNSIADCAIGCSCNAEVDCQSFSDRIDEIKKMGNIALDDYGSAVQSRTRAP